tara:strand:+ start:2121 stop:2483 length:363 start_codon:yes stop_codon:yes gene_type:complete
MPLTINVTILESNNRKLTENLTRVFKDPSELASTPPPKKSSAPAVDTNISISPIVTLLTNQYIATINPGKDGEIPGNDIGLDRGMVAGRINLTLSRTSTQDVGINLGLPSGMSTSSDFDA